jgi:transcriptional regulator with XRE-family HTH domain
LPEAPELVRGNGFVNDQGMITTQTYALVLAGNVAAARTRMRLRQSSLAARMRELGWAWHPQTVSELEAGRRAIRAEELLALSIALETTVSVLTTAPVGMTAVTLPNGEVVGAQRIVTPDGTFTWDGDRLKVTPSAQPGPLIDALIAERRRDAAGLEALRDELRRRGGGESGTGDPDAEDIPVRRPRS